MAVFPTTDRAPATGTWAAAGATIVTGRTVSATITSTGDATDRTAEINAALLANPNNQVVQLGAGNFVVSGVINNNRTNRGLKGTLDGVTGERLSTLDLRAASAGTVGITMSGEEPWTWPTGGRAVTVADLTKGATTFHVSSTTSLFANQMCRIFLENEAATPVFHVYGTARARSQMFYITSVDAGASTVTVAGPGCYGDYTHASGATLYIYQGTDSNIGLEDLNLECANSVGGLGTIERPIIVQGLYNSWIKNVEVNGFTRKGIYFLSCLQCTMRDCDLIGAATAAGTSMGGVVADTLVGSLVENNMILDSFPNIEVNFSSCGNVFGYNFLRTEFASGGGLNCNHGPFNHFNLYEGNIAHFIQCDGYFGGAGWDLIARNWFFGKPLETASSAFTNAFNRLTRNYSVGGNQFGKTGVGTVGYSFGNPNIGNSSYSGTAQLSAGDHWINWDTGTGAPRVWPVTLTTRTSSTAGTLTFATGLGPEMQAHKDACIAGGNSAYILVNWDTGGQACALVLGTITGDVADFSLAAITLPAALTEGDATPGNTGFQEQDLDAFATYDGGTTLLVGNYLGGATNSIPANEAIGSYVIEDSYYLATEPAFFDGRTLPVFDSTSPSETYATIPAGERYNDLVGAPTAPTALANIATGGAVLNIVLSEPCTAGAGGTGGITLSASGGAVTATYSSGDTTTTWAYNLSRTVSAGETVTWSYSTANGIEATDDGEDLAAVSGASVTNNSTQGSSVLTAGNGVSKRHIFR